MKIMLSFINLESEMIQIYLRSNIIENRRHDFCYVWMRATAIKYCIHLNMNSKRIFYLLEIEVLNTKHYHSVALHLTFLFRVQHKKCGENRKKIAEQPFNLLHIKTI